MEQHSKKKSILSHLQYWLPQRSRRQLLVLLAVHLASYYGGKLLVGSRDGICLDIPLDAMIPQIPWTTAIYFGCFLFWVVNYVLILKTEADGTYRFFRAEIFGKIISMICYAILPTTLQRGEVIGTGFFPFCLRILYAVDTPKCLFPSMHCFVSWMCVIGLRGKEQIPMWYKMFSIVVAIAVFIATLTTKQHVVVDVISGIVLAELSWLISGLIEKQVYKKSIN